MQNFFRDIFEYHHHFNQLLADQLLNHQDQIGEKSLALFSHAINAHQIWNARILSEKPLAVHQMHSIQECKLLDDQNYQTSLNILDSFDLQQKITYQNSKGKSFENTIQEILFHIANHFSHHKGQIIANIRQAGIEPIMTDYIFYKR